MIGDLRLVQNTGSTGKSAAQLIADEKCSAALDDTGEDTSLQSVDYSDTTWALLFNSAEDSVFADQELRQALAGIARENVDVPSSGLYTAAEGLVPTGLSVDGIDYRKSARNPLPTITDPRTLYLNARQGMASSDFSGVTILLPKEAGLTELAEQINGAWQKDCSLFFSVEEVPQEEFDKRLAAGSYTIALAPHPRRRRQRIPDAAAVHGRGRRPDRLVRPHLFSASGRECPADRQRPLCPAGRL